MQKDNLNTIDLNRVGDERCFVICAKSSENKQQSVSDSYSSIKQSTDSYSSIQPSNDSDQLFKIAKKSAEKLEESNISEDNVSIPDSIVSHKQSNVFLNLNFDKNTSNIPKD